jgi:SlyX protein
MNKESEMPQGDNARIEALEIRAAYQEDVIETLNAAVTEQWQKIDALTRQIAMLNDRLQDAERRMPAAPSSEPPPPHY